VPVVLAALAAVVILMVGFPASTLWAQHRQLSAASAQLTELEHQNQVLTEQEHRLSSNVEIARLARADYQLIPRGQTLFDILPAAAAAGASARSGATIGDPGGQSLVTPSDAPSMSLDPGLPSGVPASPPHTGSTAGPTTSPRASAPSSFWARVGNTLEFWK
jgi:cell division protein FtsB